MTLSQTIKRELLARRIERVLASVPRRTITPSTPMDTPNQRHAAFAVLRAARLVSVGNWLAHKAQGRLAILEKQIAADIKQHATGWSMAALPSLFKEFQRECDAAFDWLKGELTDDMDELSGILSEHTLAAGAQHFKTKAATGLSPSGQQTAKLVLGAPLPEHLDKVESDLIFRLKAETRKAVEAGCTAAETVRRLGLGGESVQATVRAGDVPGHEFHGNQWTEGEKVETKSIFGNAAADPPWDKIAKMDEGGGHWTMKEVKLTDLTPTQETVEKEKVEHFRQHGSDSPAEVIRKGGKLFIHDGHHRLAGDIARGDKTATVKIFSRKHDESNTIHAALDPLSAISIRLFDTTDNSLWKFIQAAVQTMAYEVDQDSFDDLNESDEAPTRMGYVWVASGEPSMCDFCEYMDGATYDENKDPVGDSPELEVEPQAHIGCKCALIPCDLDAEMPRGNFHDYLDNFSREEKETAFGAGNYKSYQRGEMSAADLMNQKTNELPLKDFEKLNVPLANSPGMEESNAKWAASGDARVARLLDQRKLIAEGKL